MNSRHLDKLIAKGLAISDNEAGHEHLGFIARSLVQTTLPHSKPSESTFTRVNGDCSLTVQSVPKIGLPYGSLPRLILAWITTEAVKTKSREIVLSDSLSAFMRDLEIVPTGGRWGSVTRLKNQMQRLFTSSFIATYKTGDEFHSKILNPVAKSNIWWSPADPKQATLFESKITLGYEFFEEVVNRPVPIDKRALLALKKSPMSIDIYQWLTYRNSYATKPVFIAWSNLQAQFGADYADTKQGKYEFKRRFGEAYRRVNIVYPDGRLEPESDGILLLPSRTHIRKVRTKKSY